MTMKKFGEIVTEEFGLASKVLEQALQAQKEGKDLIGEILIKNGELDEFSVLQVLGIMFDMEVRKSLPPDFKTAQNNSDRHGGRILFCHE